MSDMPRRWSTIVVLAVSLAAWLGSAAAASAADPLTKSISMSGPQPLREDNHPNDYRAWGNRQYFKDSHTRWVELWASWYDLRRASRATSRDSSWSYLDTSPALRRL